MSPADGLPWIVAASAGAAFVTGVVVTIAYVRVIWTSKSLARHFAISLFCCIGSYAWRAAFWDMGWAAMGADRAAFLDLIVGEQTVNLFWNAVFAFGCYHALIALHLMIPEDERHEWPLWRAWLYPWFSRRR